MVARGSGYGLGFDLRLEAEVFLDRCEALEEVIDFFGEAGCIAGRFVERLQITAWLAKSVLGLPSGTSPLQGTHRLDQRRQQSGNFARCV